MQKTAIIYSILLTVATPYPEVMSFLLYACIYVCACLCMCVYACVGVRTCVYACVACVGVRLCVYACVGVVMYRHMGWLRVVGSLTLYLSFAKEPYKRDYILQKRPIILRSLLIVATPYESIVCRVRVYMCVRVYVFVCMLVLVHACAIMRVYSVFCAATACH